jgi:hypothetical protein
MNVAADGRELEHVVDAAQRERFACERHHRDRRVLQIELAALGRDDDLFQHLSGRGSGGPEERADGRCEKAHASNGQSGTLCHGTLPLDRCCAAATHRPGY